MTTRTCSCLEERWSRGQGDQVFLERTDTVRETNKVCNHNLRFQTLATTMINTQPQNLNTWTHGPGPGQLNAEQIYTLKILFFDGEMMLSGFPCSTFCGSWNKMRYQISNNNYRSQIVSVLLNQHTGASVMFFPSSSFCSVH